MCTQVDNKLIEYEDHKTQQALIIYIICIYMKWSVLHLLFVDDKTIPFKVDTGENVKCLGIKHSYALGLTILTISIV